MQIYNLFFFLLIQEEYNSNNFTTLVIRPATVCGYSLRQRLDVIVNIFVNLAYHKRKISVFGGSQLRPNIHIKDMAEVYDLLVTSPRSKVSGQIFNVGYENKTVLELAQIVQKIIGEDVLLDIIKTKIRRRYITWDGNSSLCFYCTRVDVNC